MTALTVGPSISASVFVPDVLEIAFVPMSGLTNGDARPGDHFLVSVPFPPGITTWTTQSWGTSYGDSSYGTAANPASFTAGDGGILFWQGTGNDGQTYQATAPIRYGAGTPPALGPQTWTIDDDIVTLSASASGEGLSFTYTATGLPGAAVIDPNTGVISVPGNGGAFAEAAVGTGTISIVATDQYGRLVMYSADYAIALRAQATAADGLAAQSWTIDDTVVDFDLAGDFTTNGNTPTYIVTGRPPGLIDDGDGTISGIPTGPAQAGMMQITLRDEYGRETVSTLSFTSAYRAAATAAQAPGPFSLTAGTEISALNLAANFSANGNSLTYAITGTALPFGIVLSPAGVMTGTPSEPAASASYTVRATDEYARVTDSVFALEVISSGPELTVTIDDVNDQADLTSSTAGTCYYGIYADGTAQDNVAAADMIAGTDNGQVSGGTVGVFPDASTLDNVAIPVTGLTQNTPYEICFVVDINDAGTYTNVTGGGFTTPTATVADITSILAANQNENGDVALSYTIDIASAIAGVVTTSATAPTAAQIQAGQDHSGVLAPSTFTDTWTTTGDTTMSPVANGLASGTYYIHVLPTGGGDGDVVTSNGFSLETIAPTVTSASTSGDGAAVTLTLSEAVSGTAAAGDWEVYDSGAPLGVASVAPISGTSIVLTLTSAVPGGTSVVTFDYTPGDIEDNVSNALAAISGGAVTNAFGVDFDETGVACDGDYLTSSTALPSDTTQLLIFGSFSTSNDSRKSLVSWDGDSGGLWSDYTGGNGAFGVRHDIEADVGSQNDASGVENHALGDRIHFVFEAWINGAGNLRIVKYEYNTGMGSWVQERNQTETSGTATKLAVDQNNLRLLARGDTGGTVFTGTLYRLAIWTGNGSGALADMRSDFTGTQEKLNEFIDGANIADPAHTQATYAGATLQVDLNGDAADYNAGIHDGMMSLTATGTFE